MVRSYPAVEGKTISLVYSGVNKVRGFTIVEVMVAMTVMAVGMVGVFGGLRMANDAADRIQDEARARLIAESHMVGMLARPANQLQPAKGIEGKFEWEEAIQTTKVQNLARVVVTLKWRTRGRPAELQLVSFRKV